MATEETKLILRIEAQLTKFEKQMAKMEGGSKRSTGKVVRNFKTMERRINQSFNRIRGNRIFAALAAALSVKKIIGYGDAWQEATNKIKASEQISGRQARSLTEIGKIADRTRSSLIGTVDLYSKLLRATKDVATSEEQVARATEIANKAFKAGGAAIQEQRAGILQLGQALQSGLLGGDELRSIRENAPLIAQAIADEFKTTIGGLKKLGEQGKLTSDRVFEAILKGQNKIDAAFQKTTGTVGDFATKVENAFTRAIGTSEDAEKAFGELKKALEDLAKFIGSPEFAAGVSFVAQTFVDFARDAKAAYLEIKTLIDTLSKVDIAGASAVFVDPKTGKIFSDAGLTKEIATSPPEEEKKQVVNSAEKANRLPIRSDKVKKPPPPPPKAPPAAKKAARLREGFKTSLTDLQQRIDLLKLETATQAGLNPLINDYGFAVEKARLKQELLNDAAKAGITITPELRATIDGLAGSYAKASADAQILSESQDQVRERAQEMNDLAKDTFGGFIKDMKAGTSAAEALESALAKISDKLLDIALNAVFDQKGGLFGGAGASGGAGLLSSIGKIFGFADGGIAAHGKPLPRFARGGVSKTASIFGEAGPEAAVPLPDGRRIPVDLRLPKISSMNNGGDVNIKVINQDGADVQTRQRQNANGSLDIDFIIKEKMKSMLPGQLNEIMPQQFGISPATARR